ncbi:MAG: DUF4093 domain-containing protein [Clostridia bacterium]|nr:DUF4093 domain-containing protein [Clostridia bacterium]
MTREKLKLRLPIIVEGRYDKCTLSSIFSGLILTLDGFGVFNSREKQATIRRAARDGIIVLTDSDGGGRQLRSFISGMLPREKVYHVYIPKIEGKERRKVHHSKEGYLGVEGMDPDLLIRLLSPFTVGAESEGKGDAPITMADFYLDGFTGSENAQERRALLARDLEMPQDMSAKALLAEINLLGMREGYEKFKAENDQ